MIRDEAILYEHYFNGTSRDSIVTSFSITKSFTSSLKGIAISEGYIHSVEDPITDYLPELAERDTAFKNITIRDLLMISSGTKYEDFPLSPVIIPIYIDIPTYASLRWKIRKSAILPARRLELTPRRCPYSMV